MSSLLNKTRMLNKILQKTGTDPVAFEDICELLSDVLSCNVYVASRKGKVLGYAFSKNFECDVMKKQIVDERRFPKNYNESLLNIHESMANLSNQGLCVFEDEGSCIMKDKMTTIVPIRVNRER